MSVEPLRLDVCCAACGWAQACGPIEIAKRLQTIGMLRRNLTPTRDELRELIFAAAARLPCPQCASRGLRVSQAADEQEDWGDARKCETCGGPIDPERLEAFPEATRCIACQQREERDEGPQETEYCPRCGSPMIVRQRRGGGIARYEQVCSAGAHCGK